MGYFPADHMELKLVDFYLVNKCASWWNREEKNFLKFCFTEVVYANAVHVWLERLRDAPTETLQLDARALQSA